MLTSFVRNKELFLQQKKNGDEKSYKDSDTCAKWLLRGKTFGC